MLKLVFTKENKKDKIAILDWAMLYIVVLSRNRRVVRKEESELTTNQISYLRNQEEARHNRVTESQGERTTEAQLQQAEAASRQATNSYITAMANQKNAEAAMNQALTRQGELQYKYDTIPLYEREVAAKETTAKASATSADASVTQAEAAKSQADTAEIRAIIESDRVKAYAKSIANEVAKTELDKQRVQNQVEQYFLEYGLAKSELERKQVNDKWDRYFRALQGFNSTADTARKILGDVMDLKLKAFSVIKGLTESSGFGGKRR